MANARMGDIVVDFSSARPQRPGLEIEDKLRAAACFRCQDSDSSQDFLVGWGVTDAGHDCRLGPGQDASVESLRGTIQYKDC